MKHKKILFVCMGNICRSPTAEAVFRKLVGEHPELTNVEIDSCGTIGYHVGSSPDPRSVVAAEKRGYDLSQLRARKLTETDLDYFDLILVMDEDNMSNTQVISKATNRDKIKLFLDFSINSKLKAVPDPYYGGKSGFDDVIDLIEDASRGLIKSLLKVELICLVPTL